MKELKPASRFKRVFSCILMVVSCLLFTACANTGAESNIESESQIEADSEVETAIESDTEAEQSSESEIGTESEAKTESETGTVEDVLVRVGALKGPTSMGLLFLQEEDELEDLNYAFSMVTAVDELLTSVVKGDVDIALVPANVASVLYQKTEGNIAVLDINTLGVLYMLSSDATIANVEDLKGRTIYLTGKGATPDYILHYILEQNGIAKDEYTLEYKSEATEVAAIMSEDTTGAVALLPQPFVTVACAQNEKLSVVLDMNTEWEEVASENGSKMVTGVTIVRKEFLEEYPDMVAKFMEDHANSVEAINQDAVKGGELVSAAGIVPKADIAEKSIPECNITYMDGADMKNALEGYLKVLFEQNPESIGGILPTEDFYYMNNQ